MLRTEPLTSSHSSLFPAHRTLAAPRLHHQWKPDELHVEQAWGEAVIAELRRRGHTVAVDASLGAAQAVGRDAQGQWAAAADPRGEGAAGVW
jgi:gamma-glutamyltranspeptidase/glutathione hydrolase